MSVVKIGVNNYFCLHYNRGMEQAKPQRGRPRKAEDEKLERLVLFVPRSTRLKVKEHGQEWARAVLKRAKPPG